MRYSENFQGLFSCQTQVKAIITIPSGLVHRHYPLANAHIWYESVKRLCLR